MLFSALPYLGLCGGFSFSTFWNGAPLFLNITVILATVVLIGAITYFIWFQFLRKSKREDRGFGFGASSSKEFNPQNDVDPNRTMAFFNYTRDGKDIRIAGPWRLFKKLPHVTHEIQSSIFSKDKKLDDPISEYVKSYEADAGKTAMKTRGRSRSISNLNSRSNSASNSSSSNSGSSSESEDGNNYSDESDSL